MSFAKNYLKQYNADSAWNSLGAVGSTSAWEPNDLDDVFRAYYESSNKAKAISAPRRSGGGTPYAPPTASRYGTFGQDALNTSIFLANLTPEKIQGNLNTYGNALLAGQYFDPMRVRNFFTGF